MYVGGSVRIMTKKNFKFMYLAAICELKVHTVYSNTDPIEGRGASIVAATFDNAVAAAEFAKNKGIYEKPAEETINVLVPIERDDTPVGDHELQWALTRTLRGNLGEMTWSNPDHVRQNILKKLSPEERKFLLIHGLSPDDLDDDK